jgi:hypothetical protein
MLDNVGNADFETKKRNQILKRIAVSAHPEL